MDDITDLIVAAKRMIGAPDTRTQAAWVERATRVFTALQMAGVTVKGYEVTIPPAKEPTP